MGIPRDGPLVARLGGVFHPVQRIVVGVVIVAGILVDLDDDELVGRLGVTEIAVAAAHVEAAEQGVPGVRIRGGAGEILQRGRELAVHPGLHDHVAVPPVGAVLKAVPETGGGIAGPDHAPRIDAPGNADRRVGSGRRLSGGFVLPDHHRRTSKTDQQANQRHHLAVLADKF